MGEGGCSLAFLLIPLRLRVVAQSCCSVVDLFTRFVCLSFFFLVFSSAPSADTFRLVLLEGRPEV